MRRWSFLVLVSLVAACGAPEEDGKVVGGEGLDDAIEVSTFSAKVFQLANQVILSTRPQATKMMTVQLNLVLAQNSILDQVTADEVEQRISSPLTNGTPTTVCPYIKPPTGSATMSCRYLVDRAVEESLVSSTSLTDTIEQDVDTSHGATLKNDELAYVKGWVGEAVYSGIDSGAAHTVDILRSLKVCDQKPTPVQSAYKLGEQQGSALLEGTETTVMPTIPKTQCSTDIIAATILAEAKKKVDGFINNNPICAGYKAEDLAVAVDLAQAETNRRLGLEEGMRSAYEALRVRLVNTWECEPPVPCKCYIRYSGTGPTQCFRTTSTAHPASLINQGLPILPLSECQGTTPVPVGSPLVLDLDGDGVRLDSAHRVPFDLAATGEAARIPTMRGGDALLALDLNENGRIDDGRELFGNAALCGTATCTDGLEALARHDENHDGRIDARDSVYGKLQLWQPDGALGPLADAGVKSISLDSRLDLSFTDAAGNSATRALIFEREDGSTGQAPDVWFSLTFDKLPRNPRSSGVVSTLR